MKPVIALACSLTLPCAMPSCSRQPDIPISFSGSSEKLQATEILATLDAPIPAGKSAIYCASLQAAWKALQDMAGEPVSLQGSPDLAGQLNVAADPRPYIPSDSLYAAAGWVKEGICDRVRQDLSRKFPGSAPPTFEGISPDSCLMYAYLEASLRFSVPYCENTRPLVFTDGAGNQTEVRSFGASPEDEAAYRKLVAQPSVLFRKGEAQAKDEEFAIDLCSNSAPSQIIVAKIPRQPTLSAALAHIESESAQAEESAKALLPYEQQRLHCLTPGDSLLVPDLHWLISHRFRELEGRLLNNPRLKQQRLDVCQQDIFFRLNRKGAALRSDARAYAQGLVLEHYFLDRPFLIYVKKRSEKTPYFAMWVDNAELLQPWPANQERDQEKTPKAQ